MPIKKIAPLPLNSSCWMQIETIVLVGIYTVANGFSRHFDTATKAAANAILTCYNKYGAGISDLNYNAESEVVDKLVQDFETDATLVAALTKLGCTTWASTIKNCQ